MNVRDDPLTPARAPAKPHDVDLAVHLGPLTLSNPVMPASGCFGPELAPLIDLGRLGAVVTKTVFSGVRSGNPAHRLAESSSGMLNAVGIPSPGIARFQSEILPRYLQSGAPVIVSVGGLAVTEYWDVVEGLRDVTYAALEVNVSCPNLERGGLEIGSDPTLVEQVVAGVVERADVPVIVKLTPNVTRISDIADASEQGGATAITVANTFIGMKIDARRRHATLGNVTGGVSGPAIKPMALRLVWEASHAVGIPVIGCGGISSALDAVEFILAGATAVQIGTATFTRADTMITIIEELPGLMAELKSASVPDMTGSLRISA